MKKKILIISILFFSCTKEVTFDIPVNTSNVVVNGFIEKGENPKILLTRGVNPFNFNGNINEVLSDFITDASTNFRYVVGFSQSMFFDFIGKSRNTFGLFRKVYKTCLLTFQISP